MLLKCRECRGNGCFGWCSWKVQHRRGGWAKSLLTDCLWDILSAGQDPDSFEGQEKRKKEHFSYRCKLTCQRCSVFLQLWRFNLDLRCWGSQCAQHVFVLRVCAPVYLLKLCSKLDLCKHIWWLQWFNWNELIFKSEMLLFWNLINSKITNKKEIQWEKRGEDEVVVIRE